VTYTAVDAAGNSTLCTFTVTVTDTQAPAIAGCPSNIVLTNDLGVCAAVATWNAPTTTDNCGSTISQTAGLISGSSFPVGVSTVTYTAVDAAGNSTLCTFTVTVTDTQAPAIAGCPSNIVLTNDLGVCGAVATWTAPTTTDNCGSTISQTAGLISGSTFPIGVSTVTYTAVDAAGNSTLCTFTVTVTDTQAPTITACPGNISLTTNVGACNGATATWTAPGVTDNCAGSSISQTAGPASGTFFPLGSTTITYTATDAAGNSSTCSFTVTVTIVDTDGDGICDVNDNCPTLFGQQGDACNDGNPNTTNDIITPGCVCVGTPFLDLTVKAMLEGPYVVVNDMMNDGLRTGSLSGVTYPMQPLAQPYTVAPFSYTGTETVAPAVLAVSGSNAIVDWVLIELRSFSTPGSILARRAALVQRDGDIVDVDGVSAVRFLNMPVNNYYVAVRHRNHLGIMTATSYLLSGTPSLIDLSVSSTATYGTDARKTVGGRMVMWQGNTRGLLGTDRLRYTGSDNDRDAILLKVGGSVPTATANGYFVEDGNMNGQVKYTGAINDRDPILVNMPGGAVTGQRFQQLP
jgi:hypothetical protein